MNQTHFHRRNLPHFYRQNSTYFIIFRLKGTIPIKVLRELKEKYINNKTSMTKNEKYKNDKQFFAEYDKYLDSNNKIQYLKNVEVAKVVKSSLHFYDKKDYRLICYSVMPNHIHLIFHLLEDVPQTFQSVSEIITQTGKSAIRKSKPQKLNHVKRNMRVDEIMKSIKGYSAREANKILNKKGSFWQAESYDHIVRDEDELNRIIKYVLFNPIKAGLVEKWEDWEHPYIAKDWW